MENYSNFSADNFKNILDLDGSSPEPAIRSGDTGRRIPCFDSCQLITTLMCNQWASKVARKCESKHWYACGANGRSVYGHVITKFSRMGSLPYFLTHGAPLRALRARKLRYKRFRPSPETSFRLIQAYNWSKYNFGEIHISQRRDWAFPSLFHYSLLDQQNSPL